VNSLGNIGGWSKKILLNPNSLALRGFLINSNRSSIVNESDIRYPLGVGLSLEDAALHSIVYGIEGATNGCGVSYESIPASERSTNAVVWRGSAIATALAKPKQPTGTLVHSDALLFAKPQYTGGHMRPVGRVWTNNIASAVAVMWNSDAVTPSLLNDPHFTQGSGWILRKPRGSNSAGWIVGEGTYNGNSRGFVMIRRN
jgi:hypothetical protein